jgi:two-component system response regulator YesN
MNPSYLSRLYKKVCGENLFDYISGAKIERAKVLLQKEKSRISDVAVSVGFNSVGYFSNVFKKKVGVSPQEYKRSDHEASTPAPR